MKKLTTLFFTVLCVATLTFGQHSFKFGDISLDEKKEVIKILDEQIDIFNKKMKKESKKLKKDATASAMQYEFYNSQLIKLEKQKVTYLQKMIEDTVNAQVKSTSVSAYGSAYLLTTAKRTIGGNANDNSPTVTFTADGKMKVLLMNLNKYRQHNAKIYQVRGNPEWAKGRYDGLNYTKIREVASVLLPAEGKEVVELVPGFYVVEFYYKSTRPEHVQPLVLDPDKVISVPVDYLQGLNITADEVGGYVYKN